jgi:hypothetical protein
MSAGREPAPAPVEERLEDNGALLDMMAQLDGFMTSMESAPAPIPLVTRRRCPLAAVARIVSASMRAAWEQDKRMSVAEAALEKKVRVCDTSRTMAAIVTLSAVLPCSIERD